MAVHWGTKFKASPRLVLISLVIELWLLTLYSTTVAGLALFLYSHRVVDSTMSAGVLFSLMSVRYCNLLRMPVLTYKSLSCHSSMSSHTVCFRDGFAQLA